MSWPVSPLVARVAAATARPADDEHTRLWLGLPEHTWLAEGGLSDPVAVFCAARLGCHPAELWTGWVDRGSRTAATARPATVSAWPTSEGAADMSEASRARTLTHPGALR